MFSSVSFLLNIFIHHSHWTITIWHTPMTFYVTLLMINESFYFLHLFDFVWKSICNNKSYIISFFSKIFELCGVWGTPLFALGLLFKYKSNDINKIWLNLIWLHNKLLNLLICNHKCSTSTYTPSGGNLKRKKIRSNIFINVNTKTDNETTETQEKNIQCHYWFRFGLVHAFRA